MFATPRWSPSPHFNRSSTRTIKAVVIHTAECLEIPHASSGVASWFANPASKVSAHYIVDDADIVQCVHEPDIAWHAGPVNDWTIGIELAGKASQLREEWADVYSSAQLELAAQLVSDICQRNGIPIRRVAPKYIPTQQGGIFGHADVTAAYASRGGHTDPGVGFPWDEFLTRVAMLMVGEVCS